MKKKIIIFIAIFTSFFLNSCNTVTKKIDEKISSEERNLSKWINRSESDLKIAFGKPNKIEFSEARNRYYVYIAEKLKIKCERKFEINPSNVVVGYSSKNCF